MASFQTALEVYKDYIPTLHIPALLTTAFPSSILLHSYSTQHILLKTSIRDVLTAPISNWQYNRPADTTRSMEIARYIYHAKKPVDTMLYLSLNHKTKRFDVIDGIHRYTALMQIKEQTKELDFITPNEFGGDLSWLYDSYMILNVRVNATDGELIELFQALNKSNPIPELYVRDVQKDKRSCIELVSHDWQLRYKLHFSATNKPNRPNINRDRFMDVLDAVYEKHHLTEETKGQLAHILERTNTHISLNVPAKLSQNIKEKCVATGCWLFIYTCDELVKML
jgi:hypothetical protein